MRTSNVRSSILITLLLAVSATVAWAQSPGDETPILARVGDLVVTEQEFIERFELLPGIHRQGAGALEAAKQEMLISLVAEKLLAANAQRYGVDRSEAMLKATDLVRRLLARDELYREEVQRKVTVPSADVAKGVREARTLREIVYVHSERREDLDSLRPRTSSLATLVSSAREASLLVDTIRVRWGEAESELERTAFSLKPGAVSPVVGSSVGWFVIGLIAVRTDEERAAQDPTSLRTYVESRIRLRLEERRLSEFLKSSLSNATGYGRREGIRMLAEALRHAFGKTVPSNGVALTTDTHSSAVEFLQSHADDTLAVMGTRWMSLRDAMDRLYASGARWDDLRPPTLERSLNSSIREWVLQDLLESMALERGLDGRPQIVRHLGMWRDHYLAEEMVRRVGTQVKATDLDVYRTISLSDRSVPLPRLSVRVATGSSVTDVAVFVDALSGAPVDAAPISAPGITVREFLNEPIDRLGIVAVAAWPLTVGAWSKVTVVDSIAMSVQLLERFVPELPPGIYDSVATVVTAQKVRRATAEVIARLARSESIEIYDDRLPQVKVSATPMMTYRILGFGGRMFAVPFVRPQTDWIELWNTTGQPVP